MAVKFSNNAATLLAANATTSDTTLTVSDGSVFPTLSGSDHTYVTLEDVNANREIVKLTAISGNTLTVVRAQDGTTARAFSTSDKCELRVTAALLNDLNTDADTESVSKSGDTMTGNLSLGDNIKATFGDGDDLKLYHTGSHSYIDENGTGNLYIGSNNGAGVYIQGSGETLASFVDDGAVTLYHNNAAKLATTSTGIDVTGTVTADGLTVDGLTTSSNGTYGTKLTYSNGNQSGIIDTFGNHNLEFRTNDDRAMNIAANGDISFYEDTGTTAKLFWDASAERLGIGTSSPSAKLDVIGAVSLTDSTYSIYSTSVAATIGYIGNSANDLTIFSSTAGHNGLRFHDNGSLPIDNTGALVDADADLGIGTYRFKDLYLSGTVNAGAATFSGNVVIANGSYAAPAIAFASDTDTGITRSGTNSISIVAGGAHKFYSDANTSLATISAGTSNLTLGVNAGNSIIAGGNYNVLVGDEAGTALTTGDNNVALGYGSLTANTTGAENTAVGALAGDALTTGFSNTALGMKALSADTTGRYSVAIGHSALENQAFTGNNNAYNTAVGYSAGNDVTTGTTNTLIGGLAGDALTVGVSNVGLGYNTLGLETTGSANVAVGTNALASQNFTGGTVSYNVGVGHHAGLSVTTGLYNTLIGGLAGDALTTGGSNVALGTSALSLDTAGSRSIAIGSDALASQNLTSATNAYNTAVGDSAGKLISTGVNNTFVGGLAGDATDDASNCVAIGKSTLSANCGDGNTAVGAGALNLTTAADNTAVGADAGIAVTSGGNNLLLGHDAGRTGSPGGNITTASNILSLGDENIATANIQVDWTVASDARDKTDFTALDLGLDFVKALAPVTYKWDKRSKYGDKTAEDYDLTAQTPDGTHKEDWLDIGFKAQEVEALEIAAGYNKDNNTNLVSSHTGDGKQMGLQYSKFVPILVKAIQEQQALIEALTARLETLEGK